LNWRVGDRIFLEEKVTSKGERRKGRKREIRKQGTKEINGERTKKKEK
jgi:hypothetical protein